MDKSRELTAVQKVFGVPAKKAIAHERPDCLLPLSDAYTLGIEVTDIYADQTDAKLDRLEGYSLGLIDGTTKIHRRDRGKVSVKPATLQDKDGNDKGTFMAVFRELPSFLDRVEILSQSIVEKAGKAKDYLGQCAAVDLIVNDSSRLFAHKTFEDFIRPFSHAIDKAKLLASPFREIYLLTSVYEAKQVYIPLIANLFVGDCVAYELLLREKRDAAKDAKPGFNVFLAALNLGGYRRIEIKREPRQLGLKCGAWEMHYSKTGKAIRDWMTLLPDERQGIEEAVGPLSDEVIAQARALVELRRNYFASIPLSLPAHEPAKTA